MGPLGLLDFSHTNAIHLVQWLNFDAKSASASKSAESINKLARFFMTEELRVVGGRMQNTSQYWFSQNLRGFRKPKYLAKSLDCSDNCRLAF